MARIQWLRPPRRVLTSFLAVVVCCVGALVWLGTRLLDQDRALESQRVQEQLEIAADLAAAAFERRLGELRQALTGPPADIRLPGGTVFITSRGQDLVLYGQAAELDRRSRQEEALSDFRRRPSVTGNRESADLPA
jgi:virulence-associated protein VagC